jgi:hypothetical protein
MVRVWGGGIYEADAFYEICDGNHFLIGFVSLDMLILSYSRVGR